MQEILKTTIVISLFTSLVGCATVSSNYQSTVENIKSDIQKESLSGIISVPFHALNGVMATAVGQQVGELSLTSPKNTNVQSSTEASQKPGEFYKLFGWMEGKCGQFSDSTTQLLNTRHEKWEDSIFDYSSGRVTLKPKNTWAFNSGQYINDVSESQSGDSKESWENVYTFNLNNAVYRGLPITKIEYSQLHEAFDWTIYFKPTNQFNALKSHFHVTKGIELEEVRFNDTEYSVSCGYGY